MRLQKLLLLLLSVGTTAAAQPTATISAGIIRGISTNLPRGAAAVDKFLGVPYAAPSTRFSRPEPPKPWTQPLDTTEFGPACTQNFGLNGRLDPLPLPVSHRTSLSRPSVLTEISQTSALAPNSWKRSSTRQRPRRAKTA